jgi:hypothetical protein
LILRDKGGPTLTLAEDFREARNWFAINMWGLFVFPPPGAIRAINQVLPNAKVVVDRKNVTKDGSGKKNPHHGESGGGKYLGDY